MRNVDTVKTNHKHINIPYTVKLKHINLFLFQRNLHHCIEIIKKKNRKNMMAECPQNSDNFAKSFILYPRIRGKN